MEISFLPSVMKLHRCTCHLVEIHMNCFGASWLVTQADRMQQHRKLCDMWEWVVYVVPSALAS